MSVRPLRTEEILYTDRHGPSMNRRFKEQPVGVLLRRSSHSAHAGNHTGGHVLRQQPATGVLNADNAVPYVHKRRGSLRAVTTV